MSVEDVVPVMFGTWEEERRYPAADGRYLIVVSKRTDGTGQTHWKNERRRLSRGDRASYASYPDKLVADRAAQPRAPLDFVR